MCGRAYYTYADHIGCSFTLVLFCLYSGRSGLWYFQRAARMTGIVAGRGQLKFDGTRAEIRFRLSVKRTSPFKSAGASVQSTTGSRGVRRIRGSNYNISVRQHNLIIYL